MVTLDATTAQRVMSLITTSSPEAQLEREAAVYGLTSAELPPEGVSRPSIIRDILNAKRLGITVSQLNQRDLGTDAKRQAAGLLTRRDILAMQRDVSETGVDARKALVPIANQFEISTDELIKAARTTTSSQNLAAPGETNVATWQLTDPQGNDRGTTSDPDLRDRFTRVGGTATLISGGAGNRVDGDIRGDQFIGADGTDGIEQVGSRLSREDILGTLADGDITPEAAAKLLIVNGYASDDAQARAIIVQNAASSPLDRGGVTDTAIPTATSQAVPQPTVVQDAFRSTPGGFTQEEFSDLAGLDDISRQFAVGSGVAPAFRGLFSDIVGRQNLPFNIGALTGGISGLDQEQFRNAPNASFRDFINAGRRGTLPNIGQSLRTAGDFLRTPSGRGGEFNANQQAIQEQLLGSPATQQRNIGTSAFFNPLIDLVASQQRGRGIDIGGATGRSLRNQLAGDPGQFSGVTDFTDFLRRQGLI